MDEPLAVPATHLMESMQQLPSGAMLATLMSEAALIPYLPRLRPTSAGDQLPNVAAS